MRKGFLPPKLQKAVEERDAAWALEDELRRKSSRRATNKKYYEKLREEGDPNTEEHADD